MRPGMVISGLLLLLAFSSAASCHESAETAYWALGDSYTAGTGVSSRDSFPSQLVHRLQSEGMPISLEGNIAVSGAGIADVLKRQWPQVDGQQAGLITLLVGVNDWVRSTGARSYRSRLKQLLRNLVPLVPSSRHLILFTLPDFSCAPGVHRFGFGKSATNGMKRFGRMIQDIAGEFKVTLFDLYPVSREACGRPELFAEDAMHPSPEQYSLWVDRLVPVIRKVFQK